jgi:hypothetical protein
MGIQRGVQGLGEIHDGILDWGEDFITNAYRRNVFDLPFIFAISHSAFSTSLLLFDFSGKLYHFLVTSRQNELLHWSSL